MWERLCDCPLCVGLEKLMNQCIFIKKKIKNTIKPSTKYSD
jgi:hypothetical protein